MLHLHITWSALFCPLNARRPFTGLVQQLAADGTLLASFGGQVGGFFPVGIAVTKSDGAGAPLVLAVVDFGNNAISFFQRTL